jgi:RNA polymerase sigma factor (sigma-70 family)
VTLPPFETVVRAHGPAVYRTCRALLAPHDAEDAWSETFVAALRAYPELRPDSNVRGWLVTIAHRKAIDRYRAAARAPVPAANLPERATVGEFAEPEEELLDAVRALPPKQRAAVAYRYLADLSYARIAELLDGSEAAARRNAADGIAALRKTYVHQEIS